ncbi:DNA-directed RNA polymerase subunit omega [Corynebacterium atypicum]|uniref:DNA-directed RNA polymerase subunit omega n=1 Tax=Corynebacterium atypicum TaxID=191610 RepID=A0ABM5QMP4_9CORY|nr:DNA-directed RNA polymerase subunit omega [Corynebacterium atypicum]AIG64077.1 DNA-directed RNA polymerase subunit omega [Corynebacterium atypicum]
MTNVTNEPESKEPVFDPPVGITDPPIDRLLEKVSSKYALAIFAAKRARQINAHYQQADNEVFEYIGPLVTPEPGEKPLSIALREIDAGLLEYEEGR